MKINSTTWNRIRYTLYSPFYDIVVKMLDHSRKKSIKVLNIEDGEKLLIVGAGTGLDLKYIPKHAEVTATDITPGMLSKLSARAKVLGLDLNAKVMDGQSLEFEDNSFDCAILHLILAVIPDPYRCIREVERVLKPGGRAIVLDKFLKPSSKPSLTRRALNVFTGTFFSDINRSLEDIVSVTSLNIEHDEPAALGGAFRIVLLGKPESASK